MDPTSMFPGPPSVRTPEPARSYRMTRVDPLRSIRASLGVSLDETVNDAHMKRRVRVLYKIHRAIEREAWLRRSLDSMKAQAWISAQLPDADWT